MATHSSVLAWRMLGTGEPGGLPSMGLHRVRHDWSDLAAEWSSGFPYFLQCKSEFGNKEFMIWATVSSRSCFCWLYRASPSLKEYNQSGFGVDHLVMSMGRVFSCIVGRRCLLWLVCSLGKTLLAFDLLHLYSKAKFPCFPDISWRPTFAFQSPMMQRTSLLGVLERLVGLHRTV